MRLFLILQLLFLCMTPYSTANAMDVSVRSGAHEQYSRLVFDWPKAVPYKIEKKSATSLAILFEQDAALNTSTLAANPVANIKNLSIISETPLGVMIDIPAGVRVRDFMVGDRLIIDVYNPAGGAAKAEAIKVSEAKPPVEKVRTPPPPPEVELTAPKVEAKPESHDNLNHEQIIVDNVKAPVFGNVPAGSAKGTEAEAQDDIIKIEPKDPPTIMTMSSTQSFGFAAFENAGRLLVVTDRDDKFLTPQLSGPNIEGFKPIEPFNVKDGKGFALNIPREDGTRIKGNGGGVLWRIMASKDITMKDPIDPIRVGVNPQKTRSGNLMWPLESALKVVDIKDSKTGEKIFVVTVTQARDFSGPAQSFIDFDILHSPAGMAIVPKVDDLNVKIVRGGVEIERKAGLALSEEAKAKIAMRAAQQPTTAQHGAEHDTQERIFNFNGWRMGGLSALAENRTIILGRLNDMPREARVESLLTLAKAYIANYMGPEGLGILGLAQQQVPEIEDTMGFRSLAGVAKAMSWKSEDAFADLSIDDLRKYPEIGLWRAYVLADLGDWQQAAELLPQGVSAILSDYPTALKVPLFLTSAEIYLRAGDTQRAGEMMNNIAQYEPRMPQHHSAEFKYLKGEKARQEGIYDDTKMYWLELARGEDDLHRAKAALALTRLLVDKESMSPANAIDKLERLRYAWRGDDLEAQINYWLGKTYFEDGQHVKGLNIMRDSTTYTKRPALAQRIANDMSTTFVDLFTTSQLNTVSALDAVTLYEQFAELVPPDATGDNVVEKLAEHLVKAGLIGRAGDLLDHQVKHRLSGYEKFRIASRLAVIRLLDGRENDALAAVNMAQQKLAELPEELQTDKNTLMLSLLRARGLSDQGRPDQALAMLIEMDPTPQVNRLRADIAWRASYWDDAAEALRDVILDQDLSLTRPLNDENTQLIMQRAIALNLAGDRVALSNMREKYAEIMSQTPQAKTFEVISRPRQNITLSDRETLLSIVSEVDLFSGILDGLLDEDQ
jgi:tetratricopeptide (TPR) repeat protein